MSGSPCAVARRRASLARRRRPRRRRSRYTSACVLRRQPDRPRQPLRRERRDDADVAALLSGPRLERPGLGRASRRRLRRQGPRHRPTSPIVGATAVEQRRPELPIAGPRPARPDRALRARAGASRSASARWRRSGSGANDIFGAIARRRPRRPSRRRRRRRRRHRGRRTASPRCGASASRDYVVFNVPRARATAALRAARHRREAAALAGLRQPTSSTRPSPG